MYKLSFCRKILLLFLFLCCRICLSAQEIEFSKGSLYIGGKSGNQQVYVLINNERRQITHFKRWEVIDAIKLSLDESLLLVYHRPNEARAYRLSVLDMSSFKITNTIVPGYGGAFMWTKDNNLLHVWGCGTECIIFRLYTSRLKQITEVLQSNIEIYIDSDILLSTPGMADRDDTFKIYSLKNGSLLHEKIFTEKYGDYYCKLAELKGNKVFVVIGKLSDYEFSVRDSFAIPPLSLTK